VESKKSVGMVFLFNFGGVEWNWYNGSFFQVLPFVWLLNNLFLLI